MVIIISSSSMIGLELGLVWQHLSAKVTCIEFLDQILASMDGNVSNKANNVFKK